MGSALTASNVAALRKRHLWEIDIANVNPDRQPAPAFWWIITLDDRLARATEMRDRVPIW
jgi:hypothetical protein